MRAPFAPAPFRLSRAAFPSCLCALSCPGACSFVPPFPPPAFPCLPCFSPLSPLPPAGQPGKKFLPYRLAFQLVVHILEKTSQKSRWKVWRMSYIVPIFAPAFGNHPAAQFYERLKTIQAVQEPSILPRGFLLRGGAMIRTGVLGRDRALRPCAAWRSRTNYNEEFDPGSG